MSEAGTENAASGTSHATASASDQAAPPAAPNPASPAATPKGKPKPSEPAAEAKRDPKAAVTADQERDRFGLQIDADGLPVNGPARARVLAQLDAQDPRTNREAWAKAKITAEMIGAAKEKIYD